MAEVKIRNLNPPFPSEEMVATERLSIIGFIDLAWPRTRYPIPLLAVDGTPGVKFFEESRRTRVQGIIPSHRDKDGSEFDAGSWTGQVDIDGPDPFGRGEVYLGNANTPSYVDGFVLRESVLYVPEYELAFVQQFDPLFVLEKTETFNEGRYLAYASPETTLALGKLVLSY